MSYIINICKGALGGKLEYKRKRNVHSWHVLTSELLLNLIVSKRQIMFDTFTIEEPLLLPNCLPNVTSFREIEIVHCIT